MLSSAKLNCIRCKYNFQGKFAKVHFDIGLLFLVKI
jgi:hypothetical protein